MRRGEVWWVERPRVGRRPYLVITRDAAIEWLNAVIAVPATRTVRGIPTEVRLSEDDGMPAECVLSCDNTTQILKPYFVERICTLSLVRMREVCAALDLATDCA